MRLAIFGSQGKQGCEYIEAFICMGYNIVAYVDPQHKTFDAENGRFQSLDQLINSGVKFEVALVAVPHGEHQQIVRTLLSKGISVIKEKPLAFSTQELLEYQKLAKENNCTIQAITPRRYYRSFRYAKKNLHKIGCITKVMAYYHFALPTMTSGWRALHESAMGGVLYDMGYHYIDILFYLLGQKPSVISATRSFKYQEMLNQNLEDHIRINLCYQDFPCQLSLSRHAESKRECIIIEGTDGSMEISPAECIFKDRSGNAVDNVLSVADKFHQNCLMLNILMSEIKRGRTGQPTLDASACIRTFEQIKQKAETDNRLTDFPVFNMNEVKHEKIKGVRRPAGHNDRELSSRVAARSVSRGASRSG